MTPEQEALVLAHDPLARSIAGYVLRRLPRHVEANDVVQHARLGLCEAALRWRPETGVPFGAFAKRRVYGAIIDSLRGAHHVAGLPRHGAAHIEQLEPWHDRAVELDADDQVLRSEVARAIEQLPHKQRLVLRAWRRGVTHRQIAGVLGCVESNVCHIAKAGTKALKRRLAA